MACWGRSRVCSAVAEARAWGEGGGTQCQTQRCPPVSGPASGVPCWEAFPEVNRALVACLLAKRMMAPVALAGGRGGVSAMSALASASGPETASPVQPMAAWPGRAGCARYARA